MHKTKENSANPSKSGDQDIREARETANEEDYEAFNGATSTDGAGSGYDADGPDASRSEKAESSGDGPMSGENTDPPTDSPVKKKLKHKGVQRGGNSSNHAAANDSRTI